MTEITPTTMRLERDKLDQLKRIAASHHRSVSQELRLMIDRWIDQYSDDLDETA